MDPAIGLAPLGTNLVRVWSFNATLQTFQLYDPSALILSDIKELKPGLGYWILVGQHQIVPLGSATYTLFAGWNLVGWVG